MFSWGWGTKIWDMNMLFSSFSDRRVEHIKCGSGGDGGYEGEEIFIGNCGTFHIRKLRNVYVCGIHCKVCNIGHLPQTLIFESLYLFNPLS